MKAPADAVGVRRRQAGFEMPTAPVVREVTIGETITVADLAQKMAVKASEVIKVMMKMGVMATINQPLDQDTAMIVVEEMGHTREAAARKTRSRRTAGRADRAEEAVGRAASAGRDRHGSRRPRQDLAARLHPPHARSPRAKPAASRSTSARTTSRRRTAVITFLDTPGHAAFTAMRARGAKATDIVMLVVAADDGVMPQTIEAIQHARAAKRADRRRRSTRSTSPTPNWIACARSCAEAGVIPEEWGGENIFVPVSARTGQGVDQLLEHMLLQAEVLELQAPRDGLAPASSSNRASKRAAARSLPCSCRRARCSIGDPIIAGSEFGRVRAMFDENGKPVDEARPVHPGAGAGPVEPAECRRRVPGQPRASARLARSRLYRQGKFRDVKLASQGDAGRRRLLADGRGEDRHRRGAHQGRRAGFAEALRESLLKLSTDEVQVQ